MVTENWTSHSDITDYRFYTGTEMEALLRLLHLLG